MNAKLLLASLAAAAGLSAYQQTAPARTTPESARKVLDQYCVTCHNDKTKTANFRCKRPISAPPAIIRRSGNGSSANCAPE